MVRRANGQVLRRCTNSCSFTCPSSNRTPAASSLVILLECRLRSMWYRSFPDPEKHHSQCQTPNGGMLDKVSGVGEEGADLRWEGIDERSRSWRGKAEDKPRTSWLLVGPWYSPKVSRCLRRRWLKATMKQRAAASRGKAEPLRKRGKVRLKRIVFVWGSWLPGTAGPSRNTGSSWSSSPLKQAPYFKQPMIVAAPTNPRMSSGPMMKRICCARVRATVALA